jgi:hypothetical protein
MNVLALTIFVGSVLATLFVLLFVLQACMGTSMSQSDALLPLREDDGQQPEAKPFYSTQKRS